MDELIKAAAMQGSFAITAFVCGASFTLGMAIVCRLMKWAPINTIVNVTAERA